MPPKMQQIKVPEVVIDKQTETTYKIGRLLGTGGFGSVYQAYNQTQGIDQAMKILSKANIQARKQFTKLQSEIQIHRSLQSPHICHFYTSFSDNENYYFVLELCNSKTLSEYIKNKQSLNIFEIQYIAKQVLEGLMYLKQRGVIHRDLKSANVFMTKTQNNTFEFKLGDFGLSCTYGQPDQPQHWTLCGTPNYISPTILIGHVIRRLQMNKNVDNNLSQQTIAKCQQLAETNISLNQPQTFAVDMWSFGILMYQLATKKCPFEGKSVTETYQNIVDTKIDYTPLLSQPSLLDLVKKCIQPDPQKRITVDQALKHVFLREIQLKSFPAELATTSFEQFFKSAQNRKTYLLEPKALNWNDYITIKPDIFVDDLSSIAQLLLKDQLDTFTYQKTKVSIKRPILDSYLIDQLVSNKYKLQLQAEVKSKSLMNYLKIYEEKPQLNDQIPAYALLAYLYDYYLDQKESLPTIIPQRYLYSWIDQTNKYGFSCMTNDGWYSIRFNDNQIVVISSNQIISIVIKDKDIQILSYLNLQYVIGIKKVDLIRRVLKKMPDLLKVKDTMDKQIVKMLPILYEEDCYRIIKDDVITDVDPKQFQKERNEIMIRLRENQDIDMGNFNYVISFHNKKQIQQENLDLVEEYFKRKISRLTKIPIGQHQQLYQCIMKSINQGITKILYNYNLIQSYDTKEIDRYKFDFQQNVQYNYTDHSKYSIGKNEVVLVNECRNFCIMDRNDWEDVKNNRQQIRERLQYEGKK